MCTAPSILAPLHALGVRVAFNFANENCLFLNYAHGRTGLRPAAPFFAGTVPRHRAPPQCLRCTT